VKCCEITAGSLREPLQIQRKATVSDGMGGQAIQWVTMATVRGDVRPLSGREAVQAMQLQASLTHRIYIRYRADLTPADRLVMRGQPLQIRAIVNVEMRNRWLELACDSGVAT
jgi:SPP1 family predicted phage head-tail adaptor